MAKSLIRQQARLWSNANSGQQDPHVLLRIIYILQNYEYEGSLKEKYLKVRGANKWTPSWLPDILWGVDSVKTMCVLPIYDTFRRLPIQRSSGLWITRLMGCLSEDQQLFYLKSFDSILGITSGINPTLY